MSGIDLRLSLIHILTDCMINKKERDISVFPHGGFKDLLQYLDNNQL